MKMSVKFNERKKHGKGIKDYIKHVRKHINTPDYIEIAEELFIKKFIPTFSTFVMTGKRTDYEIKYRFLYKRRWY